MCAFLILVVTALHIGAFIPRKDGHAVVTLLPEDSRAITEI
jgi:hypothetical protein